MAYIEPKLCDNCKEEYEPQREWQRFCSTRCRLSSNKTTKIMRVKPIINCPQCGTEIDLKQLKKETNGN